MRTQKISTKKERITIERVVDSVEVDFDFTQLYSCFSILSYKVKKAASFKVLFFLLKKLPKDNLIHIDINLIQEFSKELVGYTGEPLGKRYFYMCMEDLSNAGIVKKLRTSVYFVNPYVFWKDNKEKRVEYIKTDAGYGQTFALNPLDLLLGEPGIEYKLETIEDSMTDEEVKNVMDDSSAQVVH